MRKKILTKNSIKISKIFFFLSIFHNFPLFIYFGKVSLDIKMGLNFLGNKCLRMSEISVLPSLIAKLLSTVILLKDA